MQVRKWLAAGATVAVAGGAAALVVPGTGGAQQQQQQGERTFSLVEKGKQHFKFVDNPPRGARRHGPSTGDEFIFGRGVYDASNTRVGTLHGVCTVLTNHDAALCHAALKLRDGAIYAGGLSSQGRRTDVAIYGGTGAYAGARGTIVSIDRSSADNAPADDTVHLLP